MGIGSWPRPRWMLQAMHEHIEGRLGEEEFQATADDAVRLAVEAQLRSAVDVVTDGEQRRDNYASFVGGLLENCQLIPLTDLLPLVDDPEKFEKELLSLDVPASEVRHPAVFGKLKRARPIAAHELEFVRTLTDKPVKIALPGPYLLTRIMWMECISDKAYGTREELAGGHRADSARRASRAVVGRRGFDSVRRAGIDRGRLYRRQKQPQFYVRRAQRERQPGT